MYLPPNRKLNPTPQWLRVLNAIRTELKKIDPHWTLSNTALVVSEDGLGIDRWWIHDTWCNIFFIKVIECRGTVQKALFFHLKVSAQFHQPCPTLLGKSADQRLELPWWSSQFSGPVLIHFSFDETCFRSACSFLLLRNYQQLTKVCRLPLMTAFVPSIVVHPSDRLTILLWYLLCQVPFF